MSLNRFGRIGPIKGALVPVAGASDQKAVAGTETDFDTSLGATEVFLFSCDVDAFIKQGTAPVAASAAAGSMFVPAGQAILIDGAQGAALSVIRRAVDGVATLQKLKVLE